MQIVCYVTRMYEAELKISLFLVKSSLERYLHLLFQVLPTMVELYEMQRGGTWAPTQAVSLWAFNLTLK